MLICLLLLNIVLDFPESIAAIEDLKFCLERTNQRQQLLTSLKSAFESRLLHPGGLLSRCGTARLYKVCD